MLAQNHVSVVTGAGRGIGREVALGLARAGSSVAVFARSRAEIVEVARHVEADGGRAITVVGDVRIEADVRRLMARATAELGNIDLLVNNAGILDGPSQAWETDPDDWWAVFETNVRGPFLCIAAALPDMIRHGRGRIINLSSMSGTKPLPLNTAYSASKASLMRFTETLDLSLAQTPIRVFDYSPGSVKTSLNVALHETRPDHSWNSMALAVEGVLALASGRHDSLSGRVVDARDDLEALAAGVSPTYGRRLRLEGPDRPRP